MTPVSALLMDVVRWTERQNTNLGLYIEWWLTHPEDRKTAPYDVSFDPTTGTGDLLWHKTVVGRFRLIDENDYAIDWIRSVDDSELLGSFALEGLEHDIDGESG